MANKNSEHNNTIGDFMPVQDCRKDGLAGKKWGRSGTCYTGKNANKKANKQAAAAYANGYRGK